MGPDFDAIDATSEDMAGMDTASRFSTLNRSNDALERRS